MQQRINFKLATLVHRSLHNAGPQYLLSFLGMLAPLFGTPSLLILDLSTPTLPSSPISKLISSVLQAFLAPNNSIHALLIHIYMLILAPKLFYILSLLHPYMPSHQLRSASLILLSQPLINIALASRGFLHAVPFFLKFPPSSSQIY